MALHLLIVVLTSTIMYLYLHCKTHMNLKLLLIDNLIVAILAWITGFVAFDVFALSVVVSVLVIPIIAFAGFQLRFWRTPNRKVNAGENQIVSPADGNVIYINRIEANSEFISIKNGRISKLHELTGTDIIKKPCIQIGINMTPFDVHRNCSPCDGKIILSRHIHGKFHSLKEFVSMTENERHTYVIKNEEYEVGVVQIASKRVRRIDSYVEEGQSVKMGDWIGMIRFGSQVDLFLPIEAKIQVKTEQQVYAKKTIVAEMDK